MNGLASGVRHSLESRRLITPLLLFVLCGCVILLRAQDRGNTSFREYGDAVYRSLDTAAAFDYDYNHTAIFAGLDGGNHGRVMQALGSGYVTHEDYFSDQFSSYGSSYYGAYTLNNRTMSFTDRRNVVTTAINLVNAAIPYPSTFLQVPICLDYYGPSFDGSVADIYSIRCDGFVEYCYERNNFRVWANQDYVDSAWNIVLYPDIHNDRPDVTRNPENEASPWAQRGAPCATGPNTGFGCSYFASDTRLNQAALIHLPTYQVTTNIGPGYVDVTVRATDESGIHYIGYKKPGDTDWSYSPNQPQHPTSDSYSYTVRVTSSGTFYAFAVDNGGIAPANAPSWSITVPAIISVTVQPNPSGRSFSVDGTAYSTAQTFNWIPGSSHTIATTSTQNESADTRNVWSNWSDGGGLSHTVSPTSSTTYTANFTTQYYLTMNAGTGGTVTPSSGWKNSGAIVPINATASVGYSFNSWAGAGADSYSGNNNSASISMNGPITENASFTLNPVIISVTVRPSLPGRSFAVDGTPYTAAQTFNWVAGTSHSIDTTSPQSEVTGVQYVWSGWSDGGGISHAVSPVSSTTYTANFTTQYFLTTEARPGGSVNLSNDWFNSGTVVPIIATANDGNNFSGWTGTGAGSYSGSKSSASITMSGPITETAGFTQAVCSAALIKPAPGATVLVPPKFIWSFAENCLHKVYLATNPIPDHIVALSNTFTAGTNTLTVAASQWSNVIAELGSAQIFYWAVGAADSVHPDPPIFAQWQSFLLPDGSLQILEQPVSMTIAKGHPLKLQVIAASSTPLTYQWKWLGVNLPGEILPTLTIPVAVAKNSGLYSVAVSDGVSSLVSSNATVNVINGLKVSGPKSRKVRLGRNIALTVKATGTGPITYQWFFNDVPVSGATTRQLLLYAVQPAQQGSYTVLISNPAGAVRSSPAILTVY